MIEYQSTPDFYNEYISHHGILGQKWGKQNGPPYPLGSDVSTGSRLKKGADSKGSVKKKSYKNRPDNLSELNLKKKTAESVIKDNMDKLYDIEQRNTKKHGLVYVTNTKEFDNEIKRLSEETGISKKALHDEYMMRYDDYDEQKQHKSNKLEDQDNKLTNFVDNLFNKANSIDYKKEASKMADKAKPYADKAKDGIDKAFDKANEMFPPKDKKSASQWIDDHTVTREPKSETSTPRFGEKTKDGKIIRTSSDMINEATERGIAEFNRRKQNAINDNQDMFNDMLYNNRYGNNKKEDNKAYQDQIKRVAKEYGINKKALQKEVEANFNQREKEIANKKYWESLKPDSKAQMNKILNEVKKTDRYPIYFLEVTQNAPWVESHIEGKISDSAYKNKMFQEYKKYLEDPEKYVKSV